MRYLLCTAVLVASCGGNDAPATVRRAPAPASPTPSSPSSPGPVAPATAVPAPAAAVTYSWQPPAAPAAPPRDVADAVALQRIARGLRRPVQLVSARDGSGRLFIVEQPGTIRIMRGQDIAPRPFADLSKLVTTGHNEQGLLGLAFHPSFRESGKLYVNYTARRTGTTHVVEYRVSADDPDRIDPASSRVLLTVEQPWGNHNAGDLQFGRDGKLYVGFGDGGAANDPQGNGQNDDALLGKMLRLDVDAASPQPEIVQKGLRNPWRYAFDRDTGDLYIGDVGQNLYEEVDVVAAADLDGHNFGWNITEGFHCFGDRGCDKSGQTPPAVEYDHQTGCSITGGFVYRGKAIPALAGAYFYADYCTAIVRSFRWNAGKVTDHWEWRPVLDPDSKLASLSSFGEDEAGELYLLSLEGAIYKLVPR